MNHFMFFKDFFNKSISIRGFGRTRFLDFRNKEKGLYF